MSVERPDAVAAWALRACAILAVTSLAVACTPDETVQPWEFSVGGVELDGSLPPPDGSGHPDSNDGGPGDSGTDVFPPPDANGDVSRPECAPPDDADEIVWADRFCDRDLGGWNEEASTRKASFRDDVVVFEGTEGSGRQDSRAEWSTFVDISDPTGLRVSGRFKMELKERYRDQKIRYRFMFVEEDERPVAQLVFYTRWEGQGGPLADKCRADQGRGWCTHWGENPTVDRDERTVEFDVRARETWSSFGRSVADVIERHFPAQSTQEIEGVRVVMFSRGAWGANGRGLFDYVRLSRESR